MGNQQLKQASFLIFHKRIRILLSGSLAGLFLLAALLSFLFSGNSISQVQAAGTLESWYNEQCAATLPGFVDRGMNGWASSGMSHRCWQYPHGLVRHTGVITYVGNIHGVGFQINTLTLGNRTLEFLPRNSGGGADIPITTGTGTYLVHDGSLPSTITDLYDHVLTTNNVIGPGYFGWEIWGPFLSEEEFISIDISNIAIFDEGPLPPLPGGDDGGLYPLLDPMVQNHGGECPVCTAVNARGFVGGPIDTYSGNLSYAETDLSIPVAGGSLEFRRSYASQATQEYTTTLGYGWTHNYETRLHFTHTTLSNTVELQAAGGSLLPFFITNTNDITTYIPYPGRPHQILVSQDGLVWDAPSNTWGQHIDTYFNRLSFPRFPDWFIEWLDKGVG